MRLLVIQYTEIQTKKGREKLQDAIPFIKTGPRLFRLSPSPTHTRAYFRILRNSNCGLSNEPLGNSEKFCFYCNDFWKISFV